MITGMRGKLTRLMENEARLSIGQLEYQVLIPEFVRRKLQDLTGTEVSLCTEQYIEGGQGASHMVPRIIGFLTEHELGFFTLFCTVNKIGPKKALKALTQAPLEVAKAIARKDTAWLSKLPGIGANSGKCCCPTSPQYRPLLRFGIWSIGYRRQGDWLGPPIHTSQ